MSIAHSSFCVVCRPTGELDASVGLRDAFELLSAEPRVVVDLSAVTFIDSSALGALLGLARRIDQHGGRLAIVCQRESLRRLFMTVGFDRIVPVSVSLEAALAGLLQVCSRMSLRTSGTGTY